MTMINNFRQAYGLLANTIFNHHFEIVVADTPDLQKISHQLRYQIFCVERKFDMPAQNQMEQDEYDHRAVHFMIKLRHNGAFIGTGRLIMPSTTGSVPLLDKLSPNKRTEFNLYNPTLLKRTCEISRLGFLRQYSRFSHKTYGLRPSWLTFLLGKRLSDMGKLGLYRGIFTLAKQNGMDDCVFCTDAFLITRFKKIGFKVYDTIDDSLNVHGPVTAIKFNVDAMLEDGKKNAPARWAIVTDNGTILRKTADIVHAFPAERITGSTRAINRIHAR